MHIVHTLIRNKITVIDLFIYTTDLLRTTLLYLLKLSLKFLYKINYPVSTVGWVMIIITGYDK